MDGSATKARFPSGPGVPHLPSPRSRDGPSASAVRQQQQHPVSCAPSGLDDGHLHTARVTWRHDESEPGQQFELAVGARVRYAGAPRPTRERSNRPRCARRRDPAGRRSYCHQKGGCRRNGRSAGVCLTTMSMPPRSKSCSLNGRRRASRSATAGCYSSCRCPPAHAAGMFADVHVDGISSPSASRSTTALA